MSKLLKIGLFYILLFTILISPCFGAWTQIQFEGNWEVATDTHWKTDTTDTTWSTAKLKHENTVSSFSSWYFEFKWNGLEGGGWFVTDSDVDTRTTFTVQDQNQTHKLEIVLRGCGGIYAFGYYGAILPAYERCQRFLVYFDGSEKYMSSIHKFDRMITKVWIQKNGDDKIDVFVRTYYYEINILKCQEGFNGTYTVGPSWFTDVQLTQFTEKWGVGWIEGVKENEMINETPPELSPAEIPEREPFIVWLQKWVSHQWSSIGEALPEPIKQFMATISSSWNYATQIMGLAFSVVVTFIPYIGIFYILYLVGVVVNCMLNMTIDPLFDHLIDMYKLFASIVSTVTGIVRTIWGFIKFW